MKRYREDLEIDVANLDKELAQHASKYLFVAEKSVQAEIQYDIAKLACAEKRAKLDQEIRDKASGKITEKMIESEIDRNADFIDAKKVVLARKAESDLARALKESWFQRKDMLVQLAIKSRNELENAMYDTVKKKSA